MSRAPYYVLVAAFGLMTLGGFALAAPTPAELGWIEHEMTCDEWFDRDVPVTGTVRLTECPLAPSGPRPRDAAELDSTGAPHFGAHQDVDGLGVILAASRLWPTLAADDRTRSLVLVTRDPDLRRLADTFTRNGAFSPAGTTGPTTLRFWERHASELSRNRTFEGVIEPAWQSSHGTFAMRVDDAPTYVLAPAESGRVTRAPGIVLATFGGLALLLLVLAQRRWTRRRDELTGAAERPLTF